MSMSASLHDPVSAEAKTFSRPSGAYGVLAVKDQSGSEVVIFTTVQTAHAMADAFNAAMAKPEPTEELA